MRNNQSCFHYLCLQVWAYVFLLFLARPGPGRPGRRWGPWRPWGPSRSPPSPVPVSPVPFLMFLLLSAPNRFETDDLELMTATAAGTARPGGSPRSRSRGPGAGGPGLGTGGWDPGPGIGCLEVIFFFF